MSHRMRNAPIRTRRGFSLLELVVVVGIIGVVTTIGLTTFIRMMDYWNAEQSRASLERKAEYALDQMRQDFAAALSSGLCGSPLVGEARVARDPERYWGQDLADDQVFIYKAYTSPEHRGKCLYKLGMRFVLADLAERGMRELVGYAHVKKRISRKGLATLEFESRGRFDVVSVPGWRRTLVSRKLAEHFPDAVERSGAI